MTLALASRHARRVRVRVGPAGNFVLNGGLENWGTGVGIVDVYALPLKQAKERSPDTCTRCVGDEVRREQL